MAEVEYGSGNADEIRRQAAAYVVRLVSGEGTAADVAEMRAWASECPRHAQALAEAATLRQMARDLHNPASTNAVASRPPAALLSRRQFMGTALAASTAAYLVFDPPLGLWPSAGDIWRRSHADHATGVGEEREIALQDGIALQMGARTLINNRSGGIELVTGEAELRATRQARAFLVAAAGGVTRLNDGRMNIRCDDKRVSVTCIEGALTVEAAGRAVELRRGWQAQYDPDGLDAPEPADLAAVSGWRRGTLIFRAAPLGAIAEEINRYRPGRILVLNPALARQTFYAVIHTSQIASAPQQLRDLAGARLRLLPGDVAVLT